MAFLIFCLDLAGVSGTFPEHVNIGVLYQLTENKIFKT